MTQDTTNNLQSTSEETKVEDQGVPQAANVNQNNKAAGMAKAMYGGDSIIKTIFKITFPVFILMIVNSLYQMVDTIMAAQFVDYGADQFTDAYAGIYTGSIVMQYIMPMVMLCMAATVLINVGYGTLFSQKMGAGDIDGAKAATSTALWGTALVGGIAVLFSLIMGPLIIKWNMPDSLFGTPMGDTIKNDAIWTCAIYAIAIFMSGFQGVVSRQLRAEGHIKSMAYLPLISIPINILLDWLFMGVIDMNVIGAALATIIAMTISTAIVFGYAVSANKKETTLFSMNDFAGKLNFKLLVPIMLIGLVPFFMQVLRIYDIELALQVIKNFVGEIPSVSEAKYLIATTPGFADALQAAVADMAHADQHLVGFEAEAEKVKLAFTEVGHWSTFYTAATRPMMLIMMPGVAVLQAGSAYLGYNYGAKNYHKVNKGILVMILVMLVYAGPSWIVLLSTSRYVLVWFGVGGEYSEVTDQMIQIHRIIIGLSIANCFIMAPNAYVISTKRFKAGMAMQIINLVVVYTIVIFIMFAIFSGTDNFAYFYVFNAVFMGISSLVAMGMLGTILFLDHRKLVRENHVDAH